MKIEGESWRTFLLTENKTKLNKGTAKPSHGKQFFHIAICKWIHSSNFLVEKPVSPLKCLQDVLSDTKFWAICDISSLLISFPKCSTQNLRFPEPLSVWWLFLWSACPVSTSLGTLSDLYGVWCTFSEPDFQLSLNVLVGGVWTTQIFKCLGVQNATYLEIHAHINSIFCSNEWSWKSSHSVFKAWIFCGLMEDRRFSFWFSVSECVTLVDLAMCFPR